MSRFDSIEYDPISKLNYSKYKGVFESLDSELELDLAITREKSVLMTKLEEAHMWLNKAIKADQLYRTEKNGAR